MRYENQNDGGLYAAEIEVRSDGEVEREEITNYDEVQDYLANGGATKAVKSVIRKRANKVPTRGWCPSLQGDSDS